MTEKHTDKRTILIVDDDADLSMLIQDMLEDNGYAFLYAASIDDAYEVLTDNKCDLILLDINLPDGTGFSFCKEPGILRRCQSYLQVQGRVRMTR